MIRNPPDEFCVGLVIGPAGGARDTYLKEMFEYKGRRPHNWGADEPVISALARLERGAADEEEKAARATLRLAACGLSSVPSWMRPYRCLSNGEAARADVAAALAVHENDKEQYRVINDFACVVNRDAARSMACAVGKYARRLRMEGLVLATAHDDVCAYLQPDWCYDVAADTLYLRPTEKPQRPKVSFACDWTHGGLPDARDRRKRRETDLVREITASYSIEPEAIEKVVLGDGKLPEDYKCQVKVDACAKAASGAFDFEFDGSCVFAPPDFPASKIKGSWSIGVVHGPSGSGKTTVLRRVFKGVEEGKVATREPDWDLNATVAKLFRDKFGEADGAARLDAAAVDDDERSLRIDELTQCGRARCQIAWLLASECVLDEFTSLAARPLARRVAAGVAAYVAQHDLQRVVCATVHEDVVAHLKPRWLGGAREGRHAAQVRELCAIPACGVGIADRQAAHRGPAGALRQRDGA
jgi:energy-coupling factor transporter ATP-binding protein EcfA2